MADDAAVIAEIRSSLSCSVELPAGCGKTQLIARVARAEADDGRRTLVLTHTHAGVDALRRRFRALGVTPKATTVRTLDSWCFDLIASFPDLAEITVGPEPDWVQSQQYHRSGALATSTSAVRRMLEASYETLIVDEYQDCQAWQHELVTAISQSVPTAVFGDRMQGLFFFGYNQPVSWEHDVMPAYPAVSVEPRPWRWLQQNPELGDWLLDARGRLMAGGGIDLVDAPIERYSDADVMKACAQQPRHPMRTVAIAKWPKDCALLARRLGGGYTMIEEVEGKFLRQFAETVDAGPSPVVAAATVQFAVECAFGVATVFDARSRRDLAAGRSLHGVRFDEVATQRDAVNQLLEDASPSGVASALTSLSRMHGFGLYRREAWYGVLAALRLCVTTDGLQAREAVVQTRNQLRVRGRYPESRILARPLLIKGLEFDYAVVTDPGRYNAHELYVCLTRGSRAVAVVSDTTALRPTRPG